MLSPVEVARVLRVKENDIRNMIRRGELQDVSSDGKRRLDPNEVITLVESAWPPASLAGTSTSSWPPRSPGACRSGRDQLQSRGCDAYQLRAPRRRLAVLGRPSLLSGPVAEGLRQPLAHKARAPERLVHSGNPDPPIVCPERRSTGTCSGSHGRLSRRAGMCSPLTHRVSVERASRPVILQNSEKVIQSRTELGASAGNRGLPSVPRSMASQSTRSAPGGSESEPKRLKHHSPTLDICCSDAGQRLSDEARAAMNGSRTVGSQCCLSSDRFSASGSLPAG